MSKQEKGEGEEEEGWRERGVETRSSLDTPRDSTQSQCRGVMVEEEEDTNLHFRCVMEGCRGGALFFFFWQCKAGGIMFLFFLCEEGV